MIDWLGAGKVSNCLFVSDIEDAAKRGIAGGNFSSLANSKRVLSSVRARAA